MEQGQASKKIRIYVGGLGDAMTEDDLRKIFQSNGGGVVDAMDMVRTKSRSFAYVDFFPSSQNSVSKLFSIYNGCAWKGGKLRLEKAKEHYLVRLKREWEEDAQLANTADENLEVSDSESFEEVPKSEEIQIFFPRLGKVKSLPISGTGTHIYSFPDVEEPPLPVHFCDCEEHLASSPIGHSEVAKTGDLDAQKDGIGKEEIEMMNAVMNKLFEKQKPSATVTLEIKDEDRSKTLTGNQQFEVNQVDSDDDNLVLNVMASGRNTQTMTSDNENKMIIKAHGSSKGVSKDQKRNSKVQNKKRKSNMDDEFDGSDYVSSIPTDTGVTIGKNIRGKSSWKSLIGNTSSAAFSISHILPTIPSAREELQKSHSAPEENGDSDATSESEPEEIKSMEGVAEAQETGSGGEEQQKSHSTHEESRDFDTILESESEEMKSIEGVAEAQETGSGGEEQNKSHSTPEESRDFDTILESESEEMKSIEGVAEAQETVSNVTLNKGRGSSWLQKSSWTQLVGEQNNTSFSIGLILPTNSSEKHARTDSNAVEVNQSVWRNNDDSVKHIIAEDDSAAFAVRKEDRAADDSKKEERPAMLENEISPTEAVSRQIPQVQVLSMLKAEKLAHL